MPNPAHTCLFVMEAITHATPSLWTSLAVKCPRIEVANDIDMEILQKAFDRISGMLDLWNQKRARMLFDLSLTLVRPFDNRSGFPRGLSKFWEPLLRTVLHDNGDVLHSLTLDKVDIRHDSSWIQLGGSGFPNLETLRIVPSKIDDSIRDASFISLFKDAPSLRRVDLRFQNPIDLPWKQLTHISVSRTTGGKGFYTIVSSCPNLVHLSQEFTKDDLPMRLTDRKFELPCLRRLELLIGIVGYPPSFFSPIKAPLLERFGLYNDAFGGHLDTQAPPEDFQPLLHQLRNLTVLKLGYALLEADLLLVIFRQLPLLQEIVLDSDVGDYASFFKALTWDALQFMSMEDIILPNLRIFTVYVEIQVYRLYSPGYPFAADPYLNFARSRSHLRIDALQRDVNWRRRVFGLECSTKQLAALTHLSLIVEKISQKHALNAEEIRRNMEEDSCFDGIEFSLNFSADKDEWLVEDRLALS